MSSINFKGKNAVWNHHLSVPYQILEKHKKLSLKGKNEDENLIIEADNLIALKSLLPKYQGRIKCIYIDPPYNIGNEGWVYNDKVSSPLIKDWLKQGPVGIDDLTRHDKWLCMMTPRLRLLQELLSDDGVIFISIDDNEIHRLLCVMNEIFNEKNNFIGTLVRKSAKGGGNAKGIVSGHDYILVFKKSDKKITLLKEKSVQKKIITKNGKNYILNDDFIRKIFGKYNNGKKNSERRCLYEELEEYKGADFKKEVDRKLKSGEYVLIPYKDKKKHIVCRLELLDESASTLYSVLDGFLTEYGKNDFVELGFREDFFEYPKPVSLIKLLVNSILKFDKKAIVLDSFAGSGTTAQAVLELNKDGGNRKFILVQLPEKIEKGKPAYKAGFRYIHEITRERVRRVIARDKSGIGFSYMRLGSQIDADSILAGSLPTYREFAKYVYYLATGKTMDNEKSINEKNYFVGKINGETVYLIYEKNKEKLKKLAITFDWAEKINKKNKGKKIVYAPACFLDEEYLEKFNISFVGIPYNLFEKN